MLNAKFDFDAAWERASSILEAFGLAERDDVRKLLVMREAAVVRLANSPFWGDKWHKASKDVADLDERLARWGLA
jgi:hypothetical protein